MRSFATAFAGLASFVAAQTPMDFQPGSLQKLGITFTKIDIDPAGTQVQALSRKCCMLDYVFVTIYTDNSTQRSLKSRKSKFLKQHLPAQTVNLFPTANS
jgi:hypothetical protein